MRGENTSKIIRTVDPEDDHDDELDARPRARPQRERSRELARGLVEQADSAVRQQFGAGFTPEVKALVTDLVKDQLEPFVRREDKAARTRTDMMLLRQRASAGWVVAAVLGAALFVGALVVTWDKIRDVEARQNADDEYAMIVANWLVVDAAADHERAANLDSMLRIIAAQIGADVSRVPAPTRTHPPTAIQRKNNDYELQQEGR